MLANTGCSHYIITFVTRFRVKKTKTKNLTESFFLSSLDHLNFSGFTVQDFRAKLGYVSVFDLKRKSHISKKNNMSLSSGISSFFM